MFDFIAHGKKFLMISGVLILISVLALLFWGLKMGIDFGGDSMSDYLNIYGKKGRFQLHHRAYRKTGEKCLKRNCKGKIIRKTINGRSAHFCDSHQS